MVMGEIYFHFTLKSFSTNTLIRSKHVQ